MKSEIVQRIVVALTCTIFVHIVQSQNNFPCDGCVSLNQGECGSTAGCMWVPQTATCENACGYSTEEACGIPQSQVGCPEQCQWLGGVFEKCVPRDNFHFDVCFVLDATNSISHNEWSIMRENYVKDFINQQVMQPTCDLNDPDSIGCPHVGIVQFDKIAQTVMPNLPDFEPYYTEISSCFAPNTTLPRLESGWEVIVDGMKLARDQNRIGGEHTWTLEGVQRCTDLLLNTYRSEPRSLPVMVVMTDSLPDGPFCNGEICSICDANAMKQHRIAGRSYDPSCRRYVSGFAFNEETQTSKIQEASIRTILVQLKSDLFDLTEKLHCSLEIVPPFRPPIQVPSFLLGSSQGNAVAAAPSATSSAKGGNGDSFDGRWFGIGIGVGFGIVALVLAGVGVVYRQQIMAAMGIDSSAVKAHVSSRQRSSEESEDDEELRIV